MPWTRQQVKYLLDKKISPLTRQQRAKMVSELHADPAIGHEKKGSLSLKQAARIRMRVK
jgi:hypothetical protein